MTRSLFKTEAIEDQMNSVPADLRALIPGFLYRRENDVHNLRFMVANEDFHAIKEVGHQLKGTGAGFGLQIITDIGCNLELEAQKKDLERVNQFIDQLELATTLFQKVLTQSEDFRNVV